MTAAAPRLCELATRASDGVRFGDRFEFAVAPDRALDAFYHPFAHAA